MRTVLLILLGILSLVRGAEIESARVVLTGGANGIGYACAHDLLFEGAQVVSILDIDVINGTKATRRLNDKFGEGRVLFFPTDVTDPIQFEENFIAAVQSMGGLDIMINNAGIAYDIKYGRSIDTNVKGFVQGTLMSIDVMGTHKGGRGGTIVNMASISSFKPFVYAPVYVSTKGAALGLTRSVALSYNVTGVELKAMCPGPTNTFMMTDKSHRYFDFVDYNDAVFTLSQSLQDPTRVSHATMRLIKEAPNGAMWVVEYNQPIISLDIPNYREWGTPV